MKQNESLCILNVIIIMSVTKQLISINNLSVGGAGEGINDLQCKMLGMTMQYKGPD
jgi:hypothetical protein